MPVSVGSLCLCYLRDGDQLKPNPYSLPDCFLHHPDKVIRPLLQYQGWEVAGVYIKRYNRGIGGREKNARHIRIENVKSPQVRGLSLQFYLSPFPYKLPSEQGNRLCNVSQ